jgi:hypothetical protein
MDLGSPQKDGPSPQSDEGGPGRDGREIRVVSERAPPRIRPEAPPRASRPPRPPAARPGGRSASWPNSSRVGPDQNSPGGTPRLFGALLSWTVIVPPSGLSLPGRNQPIESVVPQRTDHCRPPAPSMRAWAILHASSSPGSSLALRYNRL